MYTEAILVWMLIKNVLQYRSKPLYCSFAMTDTNTNPKIIDFPIPANDDASKSMFVFCLLLSRQFLKLRRKGKEQLVKENEGKAKMISEK